MLLYIFYRVDMVQSQGKMNKKVATLLTTEMVNAMDLLIQTRNNCGLSATNVYIFANQAEGHIDTWQTLRKLACSAGCVHPDLISSNALRKYIATVCQVCTYTCTVNMNFLVLSEMLWIR